MAAERPDGLKGLVLCAPSAQTSLAFSFATRKWSVTVSMVQKVGAGGGPVRVASQRKQQLVSKARHSAEG